MLRQGYPASDNPATRPLIEGERFSYIADMAQADYSIERTAAATEAVRTLLCVPLRREGKLLGMIASARNEVRPFSEKEIALIENFAAQAVIAIDNARLIAETREALEQQTATAEVLRVINSSPGDLEPVFDAMLQKALQLCEAAFGTIFIRDGDLFRGVATRNLPAALEDFVHESFQPSSTGFFKRAAKGQDIEHVPDLSTAADLVSGDPRGRALVELGGARTLLAVALRNRETVLGAFSIYRTEVHPFSDKQIALLQNFAAQAVIAMENARLITETREALEQQTATAEVLGVINASPGDLQPVFDAILHKATTLCEALHGHLWTYDGERFRPAAMHGKPGFAEWVCERGPVPPGPGTPFERIVKG